MIKFSHVYFQYVKEYFLLYDFNCEISNNTLFIGDFFDGTVAIMRTLSRIDKDYSGEVFVDNFNLKNIKDKDLPIVYLPQTPVLFKNKNIFKNLYFPLKIRKINKKSAKNLFYSIFLELKNKNFNFLNNYLHNKNNQLINKENQENKEIKNSLFNNLLKIKVKKLTISEQKIITLIRAVVRQPKYILLENFFENLDESFIPLAEYLINQLKETSTILACEKDERSLGIFKDFNIRNLSVTDKEKKED